MTTPTEGDIFRTSSKQVLVTADPVYLHPAVKDGRYIGRQPYSYLPFAIFVCFINPILGPVAVMFAYMSIKAYKEGDLNFAMKWSNHALLSGMIIIVTTMILAIVIFFAVGGPELRGGHSY